MNPPLTLIPGGPYAFPAYSDGEDVLVFNRKGTAFGGVQDVQDGNDDGNTESGLPTAQTGANGQLEETGLIGCALPCRSTEKATANSPFADPAKPHFPWGTTVRVWPASVSEQVAIDGGIAFELPLVDNGPAVADYPDNDFDFTVAAAAAWQAKNGGSIPYNQLCRQFSAQINYRVIGGAQYVA